MTGNSVKSCSSSAVFNYDITYENISKLLQNAILLLKQSLRMFKWLLPEYKLLETDFRASLLASYSEEPLLLSRSSLDVPKFFITNVAHWTFEMLETDLLWRQRSITSKTELVARLHTVLVAFRDIMETDTHINYSCELPHLSVSSTILNIILHPEISDFTLSVAI